ncbi:AAA family ATPase [Vibrio parahaemolyticus]|uniref:AAA family ATPase n=1 Tax=Vibrio parahaemolyticus TaxID=670 RepID=UPI000A1F5E01|nr:AAA family ATPase [Vibrio parahaemolyticus]ELA6921378.1 AAA family ATPase [Vibrio parahaemolyticus]MBM4853131.1 AAA family ATPase [Vibrio parahaemolyticus]MBX5336643.1 AAA family ATPase [Vibrio parahaemolyticus]MDF4622273.1 AAA family ATPase [Vibrio parahaemolyticus]MDF5664820.1 AAA family ATPase [Vibrio parahaemolyticus]
MKEKKDYHSGSILQALRLLKGLNENELANALDFDIDSILDWEREGLAEQSKQAISDFFDVDPKIFSIKIVNDEMLRKVASYEFLTLQQEEEVQNRIATYKSNKLTTLDLSGLGLCKVPNEAFQLDNLKKLNLNDNFFTYLQDEVKSFSKKGGCLLLEKNFLSKEDKETYGTIEERKEVKNKSNVLTSDDIKLMKLKLKNIGIYEDLTIDFQDVLTVFVGVNGAGKTTILKALSLAIIGVRDSVEDNILSLRKINAPKEQESKITLSASVNNEFFENTISFKVDSDTGEVIAKGSYFKELYANETTLRLLVLCLSEQRNNGKPPVDTYLPKSPRIKDLLPIIRSKDQACIHDFTSWWANLETKKLTHPEYQQTINLCFNIFSEFIGTEISSDGLRKVEPETELWVRYSNNRSLPFNLESQGYQTALGWIGYIIQRMVESYEKIPQPLSQPSIIVIDEIDQLLSVKWQERILNILKKFFPRTQWIITTHSPMVLTDLEKHQIIRLHDLDGKIVADTNEVDLLMWQYGDIIRKFFDIPINNPKFIEQTLKQEIKELQKLPPSDRTANDDIRIEELQEQLKKVQLSRYEVDPVYQQQFDLHKREEELLALIKKMKDGLE